MTLQQIKQAVLTGHIVHWSNDSYQVVYNNGIWLIQCVNGHCIGLTWLDGVTMNGDESEFYIE